MSTGWPCWGGGMSSSVTDVRDPRALAVSVTDDALRVDLADGRTIIVPLVWYPRLGHSTRAERAHIEIFGDGAYIHWPDLDEDVTVAGLLEGRRSEESAASLKKWLEARESAR